MAEEDDESERRDGDTPPRLTLSQLLREVAAAPRGPQLDAWHRGFREGEILGERYVLRKKIGHGGFGRVFRAEDQKLGRDVAVKAIPPGDRSDRDIEREAEIAAKLEHENVVRLYDYGRCESGAYLIMELIDGESLRDRLDRGALSVSEALRIAIDVTRALDYAHSRNVLHRDLKPENVMLPRGGRAKVTDFGLAHYLTSDVPEEVHGGTPGYIPPEQSKGGRQDARTDIFALGVMLKEMLSGQRPGSLPLRLSRGERTELAGLAARASHPDPSKRPADAEKLLAELLRFQQRLTASRRRNLTGALVAVAFAVAALMSGAAVSKLAPPRENRLVAIADIDNATGDPDLDGLSKLVSTSLDQWRDRFPVLTPERVGALTPEVVGDRGRADCTAALIAGRKEHAGLALCPRAETAGTGYALRFEAKSIPKGDILFELSEFASAKSELEPALDRLSEGFVRKIDPGAPQRPHQPVGHQTTDSVEAFRYYVRGQDCADDPAHGLDCGQDFREALKLDPGFPQAMYELAIWLAWNGGSLEEERALIDRAAKLADKVAEKDRPLILAWAAHLNRKDDIALGLLGEAMEKWPQDKRAFYQAGDILRHRDELARAVPFFERAIQLDPDFSWAIGDLARSLGALDRREHLRKWAVTWEQGTTGVGRLHGLSIARGWLGDGRGAAEAALLAIRMGARESGQEDLLQATLSADEFDAVERNARPLTVRGSSMRRLAYYGLAAIEAYRGRPRSGLSRLDELLREIPEVAQDGLYRSVRADHLVGLDDPRAVWTEVEIIRRLDPTLAAEHAVSLAYLGDFEHAALLAADLPPKLDPAGPPCALTRTYEALVSLQHGDSARGLAELKAVSATAPILAWRLPPLFIYGERLAAAGRHAEAVEVLRRVQALYVPEAMWRSWVYPRTLYLLASSYRELGRSDESRKTIEHLLKNWYHAEPDAPYVKKARWLAAHLPPE